MRVVLLGLALVLLLPEVAVSERNGGAVWRGKKVVVRDYTPADWQPYIEQTIAAFNAMLPKRAPQLVYQRMAEGCPDHRRGIAVCVEDGTDTQHAEYVQRGRDMMWAIIRVRPMAAYTEAPRQILCHEFMHVTTGINDDYDRPHADTSCVQGYLHEPGSFDRAYARWVYKKYGGHHSGPRRGRGGKH